MKFDRYWMTIGFIIGLVLWDKLIIRKFPATDVVICVAALVFFVIGNIIHNNREKCKKS